MVLIKRDMKNLFVPRALLEYYATINDKWNNFDLPKCPLCKNKMEYVRHEFKKVGNEIGVIRMFRCTSCTNNEIILWRK